MSVNILDQNGNLKKIAHGFSESKFNTFRSDVISNIEMTDTASKDYAVGDFLIMASGQLAQVTSPIYQDMTISLSNVRLTTVEEMISKKVDIVNLGTAAYKDIGSANGVAELDANGKVLSSQLPSYVDDVIEGYYKVADGKFYEESTYETEITPETSKIYIDLSADTTYRWGGSTYVAIGSSLALGETSSTAYRGDRGKAAYDHSQLTSGNPHNVTKSDIGLGNVDNTSDSTKKTNFTGSIASGDTGFTTGGDVYTALGGKADKVSSATNGNLASLNGEGNLTDSGWNGAKDTTSVSGNPISISGLKSNQLAINPVVTFEPIQAGSGTPSPSNIKAISGYDKVEILSCGKNLFDLDANYITRDGYPGTYTKANNGITVKSTGSGNAYCGFLIRVEIGKDYVITYSTSTTEYVRIYQSDIPISTIINEYGTTMSSGTTVRATKSYFLVNLAGNTTGSTYTNIQLEEGNQDTTYEPCNKTASISESLGQTVYGLTHEVRTGKAKVTYGYKDLGDLTWTRNGFGSIYAFESSSITDRASHVANGICEKYSSVAKSVANLENYEMLLHGSNGKIYIRDDNYTDSTTFKNSLSGVKLVYELATPTEIQLTPHEISLLKDYAYVSTNGTNIAFDYHNGEMASLADVSQLGETVNELGDYVNGKIKYDSVTGTTDSQGLLAFGAKGRISERFVIGAHDGTGRHIFIPFVYDTQWGAKVLSSTNGNPVTGTSITAQIAYIDLTLK